MSQNARESLSALMDSEGDDLELRRVLKSLEDDPDAADAWRRYHLMRSLLRRDHDVDVSMDLSAGILARIEEEPVPAPQAPAPSSRRSIPLARGAGIAAAVTLMVISGVQFYQGSGFGGDRSDLADTGSEAPASVEAVSGERSFSLPALSGQAEQVGMSLFGNAPSSGNASSFLSQADFGFGRPLDTSPNLRQSTSGDQEQARLLQSYLDRHSEGAAYRSSDAWMPLLRASGSETLGTR
ncbi:sigma-E factor negative regulatory protein [Billgrantia gudaonensis]|uniref:Sigma-E factor negative regulatory protein RseA n=1 Tax=Billgrantia gudaonensis TaxID=376427 RepID=A0A1G8NEW6_9GAMM|nr:sigma-E factor negative regulatory protein [Halomonas gudaonensis]SDI78617.1 sigma-E factor negative regulatory protein RseA [Halomonas gudaonensis]